LIEGIDQVAWSRDGSYALAYSSKSAQMQRLRFSDTAASADAPCSLSSVGGITTLAIDPSGSQMAFGTAGGLYLIQAGQSPALLSAMAQPAAAAFDGTGAVLYAVDLETRGILEFLSGSGPIDFASLQNLGAAAPNPVGLAVSGDGRYLLLADAASSTVCVYDTVSRDLVNTIPLDFTPSRLAALSAAPAFLLNGDRSNEWLMILDAATSPRVYFVPAATPTRIAKVAQ
jgi:DNA-binding beta-propeller fold protein YncE